MAFPKPTPIFRMTRIDNLKLILEDDCLYSKNYAPQNDNYFDIANPNIQKRRSSTEVPPPPDGAIHDYVPFYFCYKAPMMYPIIDQYKVPRENLIYFGTYVETVKEKGYDFVFTDGHAAMKLSKWYKDLRDLEKLDWECIWNNRWGGRSAEQAEIRRKKEAEFLVHEKISLSAILAIAVLNKTVQEKVQSILDKFQCNIKVIIEPTWYY